MEILLLALAVAALICLIWWRRPDARAVMTGAWEAGRDQAVTEFRNGYDGTRRTYENAQTYLRRPTASGDPPSWRNLRFWGSGLLGLGGGALALVGAALYGTAKTGAGAIRIGARAWAGAKKAHDDYKAAQAVELDDADVIEVEVLDDRAERDPEDDWHPCEICPSGAAEPRLDLPWPGELCDECYGRWRAATDKYGPDIPRRHCEQCGDDRPIYDLDLIRNREGTAEWLCADCIQGRQLKRPRRHSESDPSCEPDMWPEADTIPIDEPGPLPDPKPITEEGTSDMTEANGLSSLSIWSQNQASRQTDVVASADGVKGSMLAALAGHGEIIAQISAYQDTVALAKAQADTIQAAIRRLADN